MKFNIYILFLVLFVTAFYRGVTEYVPALETSSSYILLSADLLITYLGFISVFSASKRTVGAYFLLLLISTLAYFAGDGNPVSDHINGLREVSNIFCLFLFFNVLVKSDHFAYFNNLFKKFALLFLAVQIPLSSLQYLTYTAGDNVGGSFGAGGSGILTLTIFILVYYLLENKRNGRMLFNKAKYLLLLSVFFLPIFINETKLSLILIPLMIGTFVSIKQFKSFLFVFVIGACILLSFISFYSDRDQTADNPIAQIFSADFLETYLAEDNDELNIDVPRITKISRSFTLLSQDYSTLILGRDYSAFKGGTTVGLSAFSSKNQWLLHGSRPYVFYLLIMGGLSLTLLVGFLFFSEVFLKPNPGFKNYSPRLLVFLSAVFLIIVLYNDAFRNQSFLIVFVFTLFFSKYHQPINKLK